MKWLLFLIISTDAFGAKTLTFDEIKLIQSAITKEKVVTSKKTKKVNKGKSKKAIQKELNETKEKLESYRYMAKMQLKKPFIMSEVFIGEGEYLGAKTSLTIMATNTASVITLDSIVGVDLPEGVKVLCQVIAKYKRVCGVCTRLIIDGRGIDILADLKNKDGSNCALGDMTDGKEKYLTGIMATELAQGALAISQSSIPTSQGNIIRNSADNKIKQGLINTAQTTVDLLKEEYKTHEPIVMIKRGEKVVLQFRKAVRL